MAVHASWRLNVIGLEEIKGEKIRTWGARKEKGEERLGHELGLEGLWAKQGKLGLEDGIWDGWRVYVGVGK